MSDNHQDLTSQAFTSESDAIPLVSGTPSHRDADVYRISMIQAINPQLDTESAWLNTRLAEVCRQISLAEHSSGFCEALLESLRGHSSFSKVDRVSLVQLVPQTNRLIVQDVACSRAIRQNMMTPGYSCYVNPQGSLFRLKPGSVRTFHEAKNVVNAFKEDRRPVQRSIAKIAAMGFHSGLCVALGVGGQTSGFLFINSCDPGLFDAIEKKYSSFLSMLSILGLVALQNRVLGNQHERTGFGHGMSPGVPFDADEFAKNLSWAVEELGLPWMNFEIVDNTSNHLIYDPIRLAILVAKLSHGLGTMQDTARSVSVVDYAERVGVIVKHQRTADAARRIASSLACSPWGVGFHLVAEEDQVEIKFNREIVGGNCGQYFYSTLST